MLFRKSLAPKRDYQLYVEQGGLDASVQWIKVAAAWDNVSVSDADLTGDDKVTNADAVLLCRVISEDDTLTGEIPLAKCDISNDGIVNVVDAMFLMKAFEKSTR